MQHTAANPADFWHLPRNAALHGPAFDAHLRLNLWIALALLVLAHLLMLTGFAIRRRAQHSTHKVLLQYLPLAALTILFFGLAFRAQQLWAAQRYTGADLAALQVEVTGMQFAWYFRYPGADYVFGHTKLSLASAAEGNPLGLDPTDRYGRDDLVTSILVLPAGREVDLSLNAQDVIHGFAVPEMRLKQNAIPGQVVHIHFTPTTPGDYAILCTQVCGLGHYRMTATMRILPQPAFNAWLLAQQAAKAGQP